MVTRGNQPKLTEKNKGAEKDQGAVGELMPQRKLSCQQDAIAPQPDTAVHLQP